MIFYQRMRSPSGTAAHGSGRAGGGGGGGWRSGSRGRQRGSSESHRRDTRESHRNRRPEKTNLKVKMWEEWALTCGRNGVE